MKKICIVGDTIHPKSFAVITIILVWLLVAGWHPYYLGFFSDDWSLFVPSSNQAAIQEWLGTYPYFPRWLLQSGVHPAVIAARPLYAFFLFGFNLVFSDSPFMWQSASALLLLLAVFSIYFLIYEILGQYEFQNNERILGSAIAAVVYLIGPWSIVMSAWPTASITLLSQIFVVSGLTKLISNQARYVTFPLILLAFGFLIYESYWLFFMPLTIVIWTIKKWSNQDCIRFAGVVIFALVIAISIKGVLSNLWGISGKAINQDILNMFIQNIEAYPRVLGNALEPIPFQNFLYSIIGISLLSLILKFSHFYIAIASLLSLLVGLASSALLYASVGYGLAGTGFMSRTLAAQNIYFSLFIAIVMMPSIVAMSQLSVKDILNNTFAYKLQALFLTLSWCIFVSLLVVLAIGVEKRSNEWATLWNAEIRALKQFPILKLKDDVTNLEQNQQLAIIVQIDADVHGEIFGAQWEIGPALVWMYPELKLSFEKRKLNFIIGREAEWSSVWDGTKITQRWCNNNSAIVNVSKATKVVYVRLKLDGSYIYRQLLSNVETGC